MEASCSGICAHLSSSSIVITNVYVWRVDMNVCVVECVWTVDLMEASCSGICAHLSSSSIVITNVYVWRVDMNVCVLSVCEEWT